MSPRRQRLDSVGDAAFKREAIGSMGSRERAIAATRILRLMFEGPTRRTARIAVFYT
jgi:hypothetical protein